MRDEERIENRFARENDLLVVHVPAYGALVFRVRSVENKGFHKINYGPLPIKAGETLNSYLGGSVTVPVDGVFPPASYTPYGRTFPALAAIAGFVTDASDMWYVHEDARDRIFHVIHKYSPAFLRVDVQIPVGVRQVKFQKGRVIIGVDSQFGFTRGGIEIVHIPRLRYGFRWGNDTNMAVITNVKFYFAEYKVEIPRDPELIYNAIIRKIPVREISLPVFHHDDTIKRELETVYGFSAFPYFGLNQKDKAIEVYKNILTNAKI